MDDYFLTQTHTSHHRQIRKNHSPPNQFRWIEMLFLFFFALLFVEYIFLLWVIIHPKYSLDPHLNGDIFLFFSHVIVYFHTHQYNVDTQNTQCSFLLFFLLSGLIILNTIPQINRKQIQQFFLLNVPWLW